MGNNLKSFEEYKFFKISKEKSYNRDGHFNNNTRDINEPFFIKNKLKYQWKKSAKKELDELGIDFDYFNTQRQLLINAGAGKYQDEYNEDIGPIEAIDYSERLDAYIWNIDSNTIYLFKDKDYDILDYWPAGKPKRERKKFNNVQNQLSGGHDLEGMVNFIINNLAEIKALQDKENRDYREKISKDDETRRKNIRMPSDELSDLKNHSVDTSTFDNYKYRR